MSFGPPLSTSCQPFSPGEYSATSNPHYLLDKSLPWTSTAKLREHTEAAEAAQLYSLAAGFTTDRLQESFDVLFLVERQLKPSGRIPPETEEMHPGCVRFEVSENLSNPITHTLDLDISKFN